MKMFLIALILLLSQSARPAWAEKPLTVLELFTSQSCSSCPPADKYLAELAQQDNFIALSCHVTYWDHLRWKDTLSQRFCDLRQYSYSGAQGRRGVYTPQMIINGLYGVNGADRDDVQDAIKKTPAPPVPLSLVREDDHLTLKLPTLGTDQDATLYLVRYRAAQEQDIAAGENRGRSVKYTNAMQELRKVGTWDGTAQTRLIDISAANETDGFAVLAQQHQWGAIIAAGKL